MLGAPRVASETINRGARKIICTWLSVKAAFIMINQLHTPRQRYFVPDKRNSPAQAAIAEKPDRASHSGSRRLLRPGIIIFIVIALLGLLFSFAPGYLARYLIVSELDELGIEYEGIQTLEFNPWTRELRVGPMNFGVGPSERGQLGELHLKLRLVPLFQRRVSVERALVRGINLVLTRDTEDVLALNGIPLNRFTPSPKVAAHPEEGGTAWGADVDTVELRDSRLIYQVRDRGDLQVDVERLALMEFDTGDPKRPGRFELTARVNDVQLDWSGEARPFADNVTLAIDSHTQNADVPKLVRFTGPWGLDRRDGTYDAELKYQVTWFDSGQLDVHTLGSIDIQGVDYARVGEFELTFERAKVDLDVRYSWNTSGDFALQGQVGIDLGRCVGTLGEDTRFAAAASRVVITGLDTAYAGDGMLHLAAQPEADLESVAFSGPIEISVGKVIELLALLQSLSAGTVVSTVDTGLADYAKSSVVLPNSDVTVGRLRSQVEAFSLQSNAGSVELDLKTNSDLIDIHIVANERDISIERLQSLLKRLNVKSGQGRLTVEMTGSNSLLAGTSVSPIGELKIGTFEIGMDSLGLQAQTGAVSLQMAAASQVNGLSALLFPQGARPEGQLHLGAASAVLSKISLDAQGGTFRWQAAGGGAVDSLTADFAKGEAGALKVGRAELEALQINERLQLAADALTIDGLDVYVKRSLLMGLLGDDDVGATEVVAAVDAAAQPGVEAALPERAAQDVDVRQLQVLLTELGHAPGPVDGLLGRRTVAAIREFQRREGMPVDGRPTDRLLAALQSRAAGTAHGDVAPVPQIEVPGPVAGPAVKLGRFALAGNTVLRFRDDVVRPHVNVDTLLKELQLRNLDTQKAALRTELNLIADVNESTHVELTGWIAGFEKTSDLDITAKVDKLELSTYSPYAAKAAGVYLEGGQLDAVTVAKAQQGALQGKIQLELNDVAFRPLSKEDTERLSAKVDVPLETVASLLQDHEGHISLTLPISGALHKPEVDVSSAVNKAVGGALASVFPPSMAVSILEGIFEGSSSTLEPIEFAPGSVELGEAGKRYADDLVRLLAERPRLSLRVCGRSTAQDMQQFVFEADAAAPPAARGKDQAGAAEVRPVPDPLEAEQTLIELAVQRQRNVRRYLIKEKGVDVGRVSECRAILESAEKGSPRVEIYL